MTETIQLLSGLSASVLNALARNVGIPKHVTRKPELIAEFDRFLRENLPKLVHSLSNDEKKLLAEAAHDGGYVDPVRFTAKYGVECPLPQASSYWDSNASPMLLLIGDQYGLGHMPASIAEQLRNILEKPPEATLNVTENLPTVVVPKVNWPDPGERPVHVHEGESIVFQELRSVLKLVQAGKLKVTEKSGRPTEDAVRLISQVLVHSDFCVEPPPEDFVIGCTEPGGPIRAHAWGVLVQQCGWAKAKSARLIITSQGQKLLPSGDISEFRAGIHRFLSDDTFDEFNRITNIRGQSGKGKRYQSAPGQRKEAISKAIAEWPVGHWMAFDEAVRYMDAMGHSFMVTENEYLLYFGNMQYGMLGGCRQDLSRQYLRALLFESLATLGLIDVGYVYPHDLWPELGGSWGIDELDFCSRYDGLLYVRLNRLGAYCLGLNEMYEASPAQVQPNLRVLPNREIALVGPLAPADRHVLSMFAVERSEFVWELDAGRLLTHMESGGAVEDARQFLESHSAHAIPQTIEVMLSDLARRSSVVCTAQEALLIELADETTAALIAHDRHAGKFCRHAGGKYLVVPRQSCRSFRSTVKKLGYIIPHDRWPA